MDSYSRLVKVIADFTVFLEFTRDELLDPDTAVTVMEQLASELQLMNDKERADLSDKFREISKKYVAEQRKYIRELPESLGLI